MLKDSKVTTVLPAEDLDRAIDFYQNKLGLKKVEGSEQMGGVAFEAGEGSQIYIYERARTVAQHTVASFSVDKIEDIMGELREKGVKFEEYDMGELKTVNGVATMGDMKAAWFKDTEGNILALDQYSK